MKNKQIHLTQKQILWFILFLLIGTSVFHSYLMASEPIPAPKQKKPIALVDGTIYTVSGEVIEGGTVLFEKGKITAIGKNVRIPENAERISLTGKRVYPGLIDAYTNLGLTEIGSVRGTLDMNETGLINPNSRVEVAVHPESELIPVARSGGITIAIVTPGGGVISGTSAAMMLDGWTWEEMTLKAPLALVVNWPSMVYSPGRFMRLPKEEWQKQRDEQLKRLRTAFADARSYLKAQEAGKDKKFHSTDMRWEAMRPVIEGKIPVVVNANELSQIQAAVVWGEQEGVRIIINGGRDAWRATELLKAKNVAVIVNPIHTAPVRRWENYDQVFSLPAKLKEAGIRFCISGDYGASNSRNTSHHAATAAAYGLSREDALKSITLYPAQIFGIDDHVGSIELGKDATLMITDGDPLELSTTVEQLFIQGKKIDMRDKHKQLYEKYRQRYEQIRTE